MNESTQILGKSTTAASLILLCFAFSCQKQSEETTSGEAKARVETHAEVWKEIKPDLYKQLEYRFIGSKGNRTISVVGVPGDPNVCYTGAASGGIWKSTDHGIHWDPIFDDQPVSAIGALAIAPSNSDIVWAGTGDTFIRSNVSIGNGIYKSTDGGETWAHMGLDETGRIGRIVIDPRNPDIVFAAAMGHCYGPQSERGVFRTADGGKTWKKVLFVDENTGCSDIAMDPNNPRILFAGMWQLVMSTWNRESGGPGSGIHKSTDGGATWKRLSGNGLPTTPVGKIGIAIAPSRSNRVYALIESGDGVPWKGEETSNGVLWRSDNSGESWQVVNYDHVLTQRPAYYTRLAVAPDNHDEVYFCAPRFSRSLDGGKTTEVVPAGGDHHDIWIDPTNGDRMMLSEDHSAMITVNRGQTWHEAVLPIAQYYHVAVDNQIPYFVYGNRQDGPAIRGPSNSLRAYGFRGPGRMQSAMWHEVAGCECGFCIPDPVDSNIVWGGGYNGDLDRFDLRTGHNRNIRVWPESYIGWPRDDQKYVFQWTFPIAISPHDHNKVYVGSQHVHQTTDGGHSFKVISPDLSTKDESKQQDSGGLTIDNLGVEYGCVVFAIAESPLEKGLIWAGTNDGLVQVTRDGGANWTNVTGNIPDLPPWGTVSNIEPSRYDAGTCYITVDFHQVNNRDPFVYKTTDYGKSWKSISSDIPKSVFSYAHCVREDPVRQGLLYLGTENALYVSFNDGANWVPLQSNLPHAPVHWLVIQEHFNDLVVATYGRGFWIMDDLTPLQQLTPEALEADAYLFAPRPAYRFRSKGGFFGDPNDQCNGENPPYGASINYYLKAAPEGDVKITILDDEDRVVRALEGDKDPGINRVVWDLTHEPPTQPKLRTSPLHAPWVELGEEGWRPLVSYVYGGGRSGPQAAVGNFTVKLEVDGKEYSRKLVMRKDPNSGGSETEIRSQVSLSLEIRESINSVVEMINQIEWIRRQIYDLTDSLKEEEAARPVLVSGDDLDEKLIDVEKNLFQMKLTGANQDAFRAPQMLYGQLCVLDGDVSDSADFAATTQSVEVYEILKKQLADYQTRLAALLETDLPAFNNFLKERNIEKIIDVETP